MFNEIFCYKFKQAMFIYILLDIYVYVHNYINRTMVIEMWILHFIKNTNYIKNKIIDLSFLSKILNINLVSELILLYEFNLFCCDMGV